MRRIFLKEVSAFFATPVFYTIAGVFLCLSGLFFFHETASVSILASRIAQTQASGGIRVNALLLGPFFSNLSTLVIFLCPLLSMGLFSAEDARGTPPGDPVSTTRILLGKYLAALAILVAMILPSALLLAVLAALASPDWGIAISSYLGLVLLGGTVLSMGVLASRVIRHQASAAALTLGMALVFWTAGWFAPLFPEAKAGAMLQELSLSGHLSRFSQGVISLRDISFYLLLTVFFLALTLTGMGSGREQGRGGEKESPGGLRTPAIILILAAILILVQLIVVNHDLSRDVSATGDRLDPRTEGILRRLKFDVEILVFDPPGTAQAWSSALLGRCARESGHITFRVADPDLRPALARRFGITRYGQTVILARGRTMVLQRTGEEEIANALLSLEQGRKKNIYVLSGHGEGDIFGNGRSGLSGLRESLERSGYGVHKSILAGQENVPWDADLVIIPGPRAEMGQGELYALGRFIDRGGNVLAALEPRMDGGLKALLSEAGIVADSGMIVDPSSRALSGDESMLVVDSYGKIKGLDGFSHTTLFPTARPLHSAGKLPPRTAVRVVAQASDTSRAADEKEADAGQAAVSRPAASASGPLSVALLAKKTVGSGARPGILVFGDVDFLTNAYLNVAGNRDLAMACVGLLLQGDSFVDIDARHADERPFVLTPARAFAVFLVSVFVLPLPFFLTGLLLHRKRGRA